MKRKPTSHTISFSRPFAQFERELASERVRDKMHERAKKGMWNGDIPPFGYPRKDKKLVIHPDESAALRLIFETYIENGQVTAVSEKLKAENIKTRQGKNFTRQAIADLLRNIVYTGQIKYKKIAVVPPTAIFC